MSAAIIPFTGEQVGPVFERSATQQRIENRALRDARLVRDSWNNGASWQGAALLALVRALDETQRRAMLGILDIRAIAADDFEAEQAAAVIRFATGEPEEIARVATILVRMKGRDQ